MAKPLDPFSEFVAELFEPLGHIRFKRMFGVTGIYAQEVMFAFFSDDLIYLKVDEVLKSELELEGSEPFLFKMKDGRVTTPRYFRLPDSAADDPEEACDWARKALDVALKARAAKAPQRKQKK